MKDATSKIQLIVSISGFLKRMANPISVPPPLHKDEQGSGGSVWPLQCFTHGHCRNPKKTCGSCKSCLLLQIRGTSWPLPSPEPTREEPEQNPAGMLHIHTDSSQDTTSRSSSHVAVMLNMTTGSSLKDLSTSGFCQPCR